MSTMLKTDSDTIVAALNAATSGVDALYIDKQVIVHTTVLDLLDTVLIPSADDADLLAELRATRADVNTHLEHARQLKAAVAP